MDFERLRLTAGVVGGFICVAWASLSLAVQILLILMALDILTGMTAAGIEKRLDSSVGWKGVCRKAITLAIVWAATVAEPMLGGLPAGQAVAGFYVAVEALSIVENAVVAGVPVPNVLHEALTKLREQTGGGAETRG